MEYKVKFKAVVPGLIFPQTFEGMEIYKASTAQEAMQEAKEAFRNICILNDIEEEDVQFSIIDAEKL